MKFSQYVELEETLKENNKSIGELKETLKTNSFENKAILEFFGINKALLSWGVKGILAGRLKKQAAKVEQDMKDAIKKSTTKITNTTQKMYDQITELQQQKKQIPKEYINQILETESKVVKLIHQSIDKLSKIKTEHIEERIDQAKRLKPSAKVALKYLWEKLMIDAKVRALTYLVENKLVRHEQTIEKIKKAAAVEDERLKKKAKEEINPEIQQLKKEEEAEAKREAKPEEKETKKEPAEGEKVGGEI